MGPRSGDRGNLIAISRSDDPLIVLQWGRDLVIAEIKRKRKRCLKRIVLQWGRDLVIAEIISTLCSSFPMRASMGPRSGDRGNPQSAHHRRGSARRFNGAAIW